MTDTYYISDEDYIRHKARLEIELNSPSIERTRYR